LTLREARIVALLYTLVPAAPPDLTGKEQEPVSPGIENLGFSVVDGRK
jgi:hypothetical protein